MGPKLVDFRVAIKCSGLCGELQSKSAIKFPSFGSAEERWFSPSGLTPTPAPAVASPSVPPAHTL